MNLEILNLYIQPIKARKHFDLGVSSLILKFEIRKLYFLIFMRLFGYFPRDSCYSSKWWTLLLGVKNNVNTLLCVETKLSNLRVLAQEVLSETEIVKNTILDDVINDFALKNARKKMM